MHLLIMIGTEVPDVFVPFPVEGNPKDWRTKEADKSFAHRDIIPHIEARLIAAVAEESYQALSSRAPRAWANRPSSTSWRGHFDGEGTGSWSTSPIAANG